MFELPKLNFEPNSISKLISPETLEFHYAKHHRDYIENTNQLLRTDEFKHLLGKSLEEICRVAENPLADQARQAWNHTFYWDCLRGDVKELIRPAILEMAIEDSFESLEAFETSFKQQALDIFGSGWLWLVHRESDGKLDLVKAQGSEQPFWGNSEPLLVCDVWEHAYYIDYRHERKAYIDAFWNHINWDFVESNLVTRVVYSATARMMTDTMKDLGKWIDQESPEKRLRSI